jgi:hypothetical protein
VGQSDLTLVDLAEVRPSDLNCRLFIDTEDLRDLVAIYEDYVAEKDVVLPDPPILRAVSEGYEILAGERRITAALMAGVIDLPCRIAEMDDEEAFRFQLAHNRNVRLTTVELAYRAAEMHRLGYSRKEIEAALPGLSYQRYVFVGGMIDRDWFTDNPKLCDPSITEWYEAAQLGRKHLKFCFYNWVSGEWDAETCAKQFRRRDDSLPLDNTEKGFRVSYNANRLVVRGTLDLDLVDLNTAAEMLTVLGQSIETAKNLLLEAGMFGPRLIELINPSTLGKEDDNYD